MLLRAMTPEDIPAGVRLNTVAGWNQTEADWKRFLLASPDGCFVMEEGTEAVATAATISYEKRFAWISMVLVDPEYRNRGIGTRLLQRAVQYLDNTAIPTLKLDATPLGKPLYEKLGFRSEYEIERWVLKRRVIEEGAAAAPLAPMQLSEILARDREVFGADRSALLQSLHQREPGLSLAVENGGQLQGYAFGRPGLFADHFGPWMARDMDTAKQLLEGFLRRSSRMTIVADRMKSSSIAGELLRNSGFSFARPLTRMYRGPNSFPGKPELLCAIVGPEFG